MPKKTLLFIFCLFLLTLLMGLNYVFEPFKALNKGELSTEQASNEDSDQSSLNRADEIFAAMSPEDKVGQILVWSINFDDLEKSEATGTGSAAVASTSAISASAKFKPGFYNLFGTRVSTASAKRVVDELLAENSHNGSVIEPWIGVDHEGGQVQRLSGEGFTRLVPWREMCLTALTDTEKVLTKSALELKSVGIDLVFAPVIDVTPLRQPLGNRACSDDPNLIAQRASQFIYIFQSEGIMPVLKHFPGIGSVRVDLHNYFATTRVGAEDAYLYNNILTFFPDIGVMTAHAGIENQDGDIPCSLSRDCVGELIAAHPNVIIFSDSLVMKSAYRPMEFVMKDAETASGSADSTSSAVVKKTTFNPTLMDVAKQAVLAGNNALLFGAQTSSIEMEGLYQELITEYHGNEDFRKMLDASVRKIIDYKLNEKVE